MSGHINSLLSYTPITIVVASFLGSSHCVMMCGGLASLASKNKISSLNYHLGRMSSYVFLGVLSGFFGKAVFNSEMFKLVPWISSGMIALVLIGMGYQILSGRSLHVSVPSAFNQIQILYSKAFRIKSKEISSLFMGLLTGFMPCGWLYTYVFAAAVTQSPVWGAMTMFMFWLGSVPALLFGTNIMRSLLKKLEKTAPRLTGTVFILLGMTTLVFKVAPLVVAKNTKTNISVQQEMTESCPMHAH